MEQLTFLVQLISKVHLAYPTSGSRFQMKQAASRKLDLPLISALWRGSEKTPLWCERGWRKTPKLGLSKGVVFVYPMDPWNDGSGTSWGKLQCWRPNAFPPPITMSIDSHKDSRWSSQYCHLVPIVLRFLLYILCWSNIEVDCTPTFFILFLFGPYFELFTLELANLFPGLVVGGLLRVGVESWIFVMKFLVERCFLICNPKKWVRMSCGLPLFTIVGSLHLDAERCYAILSHLKGCQLLGLSRNDRKRMKKVLMFTPKLPSEYSLLLGKITIKVIQTVIHGNFNRKNDDKPLSTNITHWLLGIKPYS